MNNLTQGDRVFHPNQKGWGLGKVLNVSNDNIDVFFVGTGAKRLSKSFVQLEIAEGAAAKHRLLDNLGDASQMGGADYVTPAMAIERFLKTHSDGFASPSF
jgi:transcription elongation factor GreA-like protein